MSSFIYWKWAWRLSRVISELKQFATDRKSNCHCCGLIFRTKFASLSSGVSVAMVISWHRVLHRGLQLLTCQLFCELGGKNSWNTPGKNSVCFSQSKGSPVGWGIRLSPLYLNVHSNILNMNGKGVTKERSLGSPSFGMSNPSFIFTWQRWQHQVFSGRQLQGRGHQRRGPTLDQWKLC